MLQGARGGGGGGSKLQEFADACAVSALSFRSSPPRLRGDSSYIATFLDLINHVLILIV